MRRSLAALGFVLLGACAAQGCTLLVATTNLSCDPLHCPDGGVGALEAGADGAYASDAGDSATPAVVGDAGAPPPVARWTLDEGAGALAADSSGNGNQGALVNGPTWTQGRLGGALSFTGTDEYVRIEASSSLDRLKTAATVAAWVFRLGDQPSFRAVVHRQAGDAYQDSFYLGFRDNAFFASVRTAVDEGPMMGVVAPNGVWIHVAVTYDGAKVRMFVDGAERSNVPLTGTIAREPSPVTIGAGFNVAAPDEHIRAVIDDVRLYDRALDAGEIGELIKLTSSPSGR